MKQERKCVGCGSKTGNNRDGKLCKEVYDFDHTVVTVFHCGKVHCIAVASSTTFVPK